MAETIEEQSLDIVTNQMHELRRSYEYVDSLKLAGIDNVAILAAISIYEQKQAELESENMRQLIPIEASRMAADFRKKEQAAAWRFWMQNACYGLLLIGLITGFTVYFRRRLRAKKHINQRIDSYFDKYNT